MSAIKGLMQEKERRCREREARIRFWVDLLVIGLSGLGIALVFLVLGANL